MKVLKYSLIALFLFIGGVLIMAARQPDNFKVERALLIPAKAGKIFPYLNDLRKGREWSPWEEGDSQVKRTFSGPAAGKGAVYDWAGNKEVGKGRLTITESVENERVKLALHFIEPMEGDNNVEYILTPKGEATEVRWVMTGPMPFVSKVICVFMDMDKMIGSQFDKGLAKLAKVAGK